MHSSDRFVPHSMVRSWAPKRNQGRRDRHWRRKRTYAALMTSGQKRRSDLGPATSDLILQADIFQGPSGCLKRAS
jgi:hypothetical protein